MSKLTLLAASVALTALSVTAQNVTIPSPALGPFAGTSGNYFTAGGINRFQMVYDASNFTAQTSSRRSASRACSSCSAARPRTS